MKNRSEVRSTQSTESNLFNYTYSRPLIHNIYNNECCHLSQRMPRVRVRLRLRDSASLMSNHAETNQVHMPSVVFAVLLMSYTDTQAFRHSTYVSVNGRRVILQRHLPEERDQSPEAKHVLWHLVNQHSPYEYPRGLLQMIWQICPSFWAARPRTHWASHYSFPNSDFMYQSMLWYKHNLCVQTTIQIAKSTEEKKCIINFEAISFGSL